MAATAALGLSAVEGALVNGDWVNRALDELFDADRARLLTAVGACFTPFLVPWSCCSG